MLYVPRFGDAPLDHEIAVSADAAAAALAERGHAVETGDVFFDRATIDEAWRVVGRAGVARAFRVPGSRLAAEGGSMLQAMAKEGDAITAADYVAALSVVSEFRRRIGQLFERVDLVFTPSAAALPWAAGEAFPTTIDGKPVGPRGHAIYTGWVNIAGHPGLALPLGVSRSGLPIGGQFIGRFGSDADLLAFGRNFEATQGSPWAWPALSD